MREASRTQPHRIIFFHVDMYRLCERRPLLIVFQKLQKLVFLKLANRMFLSGKITGRPSDLDWKIIL